MLESFSRRAITAALLAVPLATTPAFAFDNALPGREERAAAKKTPGPPPSRQKDTLDRSACDSFCGATRVFRGRAKSGLVARPRRVDPVETFGTLARAKKALAAWMTKRAPVPARDGRSHETLLTTQAADRHRLPAGPQGSTRRTARRPQALPRRTAALLLLDEGDHAVGRVDQGG